MNVYLTTYDGFYVVVDNDQIFAYEGLALCPDKIKSWLKTHKPIEIHEFYNDAIAYGYCK